jgi:carbamoyltransferase
MSKCVLGISAYYHDSAAALVRDGVVIAAAQEERFTRVRHDSSFPKNAVLYCLEEAGISLDRVDAVAYYEDSQVKFGRVLASFADGGPAGMNAFMRVLPEWMRWKRDVLSRVDSELRSLNRGHVRAFHTSQHHRSHAASAFYPSPFRSAAVLCIDGVGEWHTTSIWHGRDKKLELCDSISYPHSLGLLYSAFTSYCGFKVDSGEYKLMGLAPYGKPLYADVIRDQLIHLKPDGSFELNLEYFEFLRGEQMIGTAFERLFGQPRRGAESRIEQVHCDLAASIQAVTEEAVLNLARAAQQRTGERHLCLAGGVALNCVANGVLSRAGIFESLWIQPAAGDAGGALGAALDACVATSGRPHVQAGTDGMQGSLLGPRYSDALIERFLDTQGYPAQRWPDADLYDAVAEELAQGKVIGWFQDRMEFGPRSLGARSIIGDPRDTSMQRTMNLKIKFRESFRPFAPAVLEEDMKAYFDVRQSSPYMLLVGPVREELRIERRSDHKPAEGLAAINEVRSTIPAVTHVDYSARVQTVSDDTHPAFASLLRAFKRKTGCPVLVNTSFNVRGEPIVCTPAQAYACFMRTGIDVLVLGHYILRREDQPPFHEEVDWREAIPLD